MPAESENVRQRKPEKETTTTSPSPEETTKGEKQDTTDYDEVEYENRWVDFARVLTFLLFASCGLSYLVSSGESFFWNMKVPPKYMRLEWWKSQVVSRPTFRDRSAHTNHHPERPPLPHSRTAPRLRRLRP